MEKWLKKIISIQKKFNKIKDFNNELCCCNYFPNEIHIYKNIEKLAEELNKKLFTEHFSGGTYKKYFNYNGTIVFQLYTEKELERGVNQ